MRRMTQVIPSEPIKDHTVVGASDKIERMPHLASQITRSDSEAEYLNSGQAPFYKSAHSRW